LEQLEQEKECVASFRSAAWASARSTTGQVTDMGLLGKASEKPQYELLPVGEYVWTLWDLTSETGQYGEQVKWVWLVSPVSDPDSYILRSSDPNAQEKEIWQFTKPSLARGSRARAWTEALIGRELKNDEEPDDDQMLRRRMVATLVHKAKKSDPAIKNEAISEEIPPRPFRPAQPATRAAQPVAPDASDADIDAQLAASDELRKRVRKLIRNADLDDITTLPKWGALDELDVSNLADSDLTEIERDLKQAMRAVAA